MGSRKKFTREFKQEVIEQANIHPIEEICRKYEISKYMVYKWMREYRSNPQKAFSGNGNLWKEDSRIAQLERKIGQQAMIIDLLKKNLEYQKQLKEEEKRKRQYIK